MCRHGSMSRISLFESCRPHPIIHYLCCMLYVHHFIVTCRIKNVNQVQQIIQRIYSVSKSFASSFQVWCWLQLCGHNSEYVLSMSILFIYVYGIHRAKKVTVNQIYFRFKGRKLMHMHALFVYRPFHVMLNNIWCEFESQVVLVFWSCIGTIGLVHSH